jgi:hypothetical protein
MNLLATKTVLLQHQIIELFKNYATDVSRQLQRVYDKQKELQV